MQTVPKTDLKAVHTSDLEEVLQKFNQHDALLQGNVHCRICNNVLNLKNIGSLKLIDGKLLFTCNDPSCYGSAVKEIKPMDS